MLCESCGAELEADESECPACSRALQAGAIPQPAKPATAGASDKVNSGILIKVAALDVALGWLITLPFGFSAVWSTWKPGTTNPLAGLRPLTHDALLAWSYFVPLVAIMIWLTARRRSTMERDHVIFLAGFLAGCGAFMSFDISFTPFFGLVLWGSSMFRNCKLEPAGRL